MSSCPTARSILAIISIVIPFISPLLLLFLRGSQERVALFFVSGYILLKASCFFRGFWTVLCQEGFAGLTKRFV
jgi:hypothetical protein